MTAARIGRMRMLLDGALAPVALDIRDDSALHAGHAGAQGGAGHYAVRIVSKAFDGLSPVRRHRLVYEVLAPMLPEEIHALSIDARAPGENTTSLTPPGEIE